MFYEPRHCPECGSSHLEQTDGGRSVDQRAYRCADSQVYTDGCGCRFALFENGEDE
jgi:transposase-like protein